jgi:hypothetical protein
MALDRDVRDALPFDLAAGDGVWDSRRVDDPRVIHFSLGLGAAVALLLATGGGVAPRLDWGMAIFYGIVAAVLARGLLLARQLFTRGGWRAWRQREANGVAVDRIGVGIGTALTLILATGGGGVGPVFTLGIALATGTSAGIAARALLLFLRWP